MQVGEENEAKQYLHLAKTWGANEQFIVKVLSAGVHASLADIAHLINYPEKVVEHSESTSKLLTDNELSFILGRLEVKAAFRYILGREPESEKTIQAYQSLPTTDLLRDRLLISDEFALNLTNEFISGLLTKKRNKKIPFNVDTPRVIFMHLPKTAGTSMHKILGDCFNSDEICPERWNNLWNYTLVELASYRLFSGHFDYEACRCIPGEHNKIFTILRSPKKRLLSLYYFMRAHKKEVVEKEHFRLAELANEYNVEEFFSLEEVRQHSSINNTMVNALAGTIKRGRWEHQESCEEVLIKSKISNEEKVNLAKVRLKNLTAFGIMEFFDQSVEHIFKSLNLGSVDKEKIVIENRLEDVQNDNPRLKVVEREPESSQVDELIEELTSQDNELYNYAVNIFKERIGH
nr:sulfotransferase family 2 domain-containing protein [Halomonas neptunia]